MSISRVTVRGGAAGVDGGKHQVPGQRGLDRHLRRLQVADLTHHDDVRVLAQDRAQRMGEGEADLGLHLDLVDAGHLVFDRVLDGERCLLSALLRRVERRIKRRGLAAAGGAGDENDAVGLCQQLGERARAPFLEAQRGIVELHARSDRECAAPRSLRSMVGMVEMRRSMSVPRTVDLMRPSCGSRRSAMLSCAMILMRDVTAARSESGKFSTVERTPSMR